MFTNQELTTILNFLEERKQIWIIYENAAQIWAQKDPQNFVQRMKSYSESIKEFNERFWAFLKPKNLNIVSFLELEEIVKKAFKNE